MQELLYTSVPRGLKPGSRGFCTVLSTQGMVAPLAAALEALSAYRPVFPVGHARVAENPIVYSHLKLQVAGKAWYVLSRVADYGLDYSQRTNKLAHHLVLDKSELPVAGPASLLRTSGIMRESWEGEPKIIPPKPISRQPSVPSGVCQAWKEMTGDAGWAGVLAESFLKDPARPVILLFEPGQDLRPLIDESLSLLPSERRWDVTFSTYFTGSSQGITCLWRGIVLGSKEATESMRFVNALRIDLTSTDIGRAEGGELVEAARKGVRPTARPTLPPKQTASREQQPQRVVVLDNVEEPIEPQAFYEPVDTEMHTTPVVNHDHSQAPPRLTPSVFKFAKVRKHYEVDHSVVRASRGRRLIIPIIIGVLFLLPVGVIALNWRAIIARLQQPNGKDETSSPSAAESNQPPATTPNELFDGQETAATIAGESKADLDQPLDKELTTAESANNPTEPNDGANSENKIDPDMKAKKEDARPAAVTENSEEKSTTEKPTTEKKGDSELVSADAAKARDEVFNLFQGTPPNLKLLDPVVKRIDLSSEQLTTAKLALQTAFETNLITSSYQKGELSLTAAQDDSPFAKFSLAADGESLKLQFKSLKANNKSSALLRFCRIELQGNENRRLVFRLCDAVILTGGRFNEPISKRSKKKSDEDKDEKVVFVSECHSTELKQLLNNSSLKWEYEVKAEHTTHGTLPLSRGNNGGLILSRYECDKAWLLEHRLASLEVLFQKINEKPDNFEIRILSKPNDFSEKKRNDVTLPLQTLFMNKPKFLDKAHVPSKWSELPGWFGTVKRDYDKVKDAAYKSPDDKTREANFMKSINQIETETNNINKAVAEARELATDLGAMVVRITLSVSIGAGKAPLECLNLTAGNDGS